jgi:hypothetical protein
LRVEVRVKTSLLSESLLASNGFLSKVRSEELY